MLRYKQPLLISQGASAMLHRILLAIVSITTLCTTACNMPKMTADMTVAVFTQASATVDKEPDIWFARTGSTANLKMFEGLLEVTPANRDLLLLTSQSFTRYALAFLEDDLETLEEGSREYNEAHHRTTDFYHRGRRYAALLLSLDYPDIASALRGDGKRLDEILSQATVDHLPAIYWIAQSWAGMINTNNDDPELLSDLPRVKRIMRWVVEHDDTYDNGGPNLFFGAVELALPVALGGNAKGSKAAFERAIDITDGKFLMAKALYARIYMRGTNNRDGYQKILQSVIDAPNDIMPSERLATEIAKVRAQRWLNEIDLVFE